MIIYSNVINKNSVDDYVTVNQNKKTREDNLDGGYSCEQIVRVAATSMVLDFVTPWDDQGLYT
jgi:hypothetical protein